jgi:hypothetical protein
MPHDGKFGYQIPSLSGNAMVTLKSGITKSQALQNQKNTKLWEIIIGLGYNNKFKNFQ